MALKDNILMTCEQATALVEKKRDGKLSAGERIGLWLHLAYCRFCALFFKQTKILDDSAKAYAQRIETGQKSYQLDPKRKEALKNAFNTALKKE